MKPQSRRLGKLRQLAGLVLTGWATVASALDPTALVPPGRFVSLETHRLYVDCRGSGSPRVLIDYGIAGAAVEWGEVQRALAAETTICVYDRAGYGWSDPGPSPRTAAQAASEIEQLAHALDWRGPLVLVGHSFGGFDVRQFAATRPTAVAGLVLLESSLPDEALGHASPADYAGAHPIATDHFETAPADEAFEIARYLNSRRKAIFTQMDELGNFARSAEEVRGAGALPAVPLLVVSRDAAQGLPDAAAEARWQQGQQALAALVPGGEWWTAARSGHEIHRDRPDVVIAAVRRVLARVHGDTQPAAPPN